MTPQQTGKIIVKPFGQTQDGTAVNLYTLRNNKGAEAGICNYGGLVIFLKVPDRNGQFGDVVLGYDNLAGYIKDSPYFGAMIGRYGNRIAKGKFTLDGKEYTLAINNGPNALHGGLKGFDKVVWEATDPGDAWRGRRWSFSYISKDGEEGYPGNLTVTAVYTLTDDNALKLEYTATTDKDTVVNLTQHSYFNLAGKGDILNHEVMIPADKFTPVDSTLIPTGELRPVEGTPFDFRKPTAIGARIGQDDEQLKFGGGYDHNWVINKPMGQLGLMARVYEPTTRPGAGGLVHRAGPAVLHRQLPRRQDHRQGRLGLSVPQRLLHGAAALPRFAQPAELPLRGAQARPGLPQHHHLQVLGAAKTGPGAPRSAMNPTSIPAAAAASGSTSDRPRLAGDRVLLRHPAVRRLVGRPPGQGHRRRLLPGRAQPGLVGHRRLHLRLQHRLGAHRRPGRVGRQGRRGDGALRAARLVPAGAGVGVRAVLRPLAGLHHAGVPRTALLHRLALRAVHRLAHHVHRVEDRRGHLCRRRRVLDAAAGNPPEPGRR